MTLPPIQRAPAAPSGGGRCTGVGLTYFYRAPYLRTVTATTPAAVTGDLYIPGQSDWAGYISYTHRPFASRKKLSVTYR